MRIKHCKAMFLPFQRAAVGCKAVRRNTMIALEQTAERKLAVSD